ncbi:MAG: PD-(D/E)XK nuclease family transposase [Bacteroidales bacterium]|nr:PD-(D/E)XK nuclease family transposase [Bacteroidales bacterium]
MIKYANILNDDAFKVVIFTPGNEELLARMLEVILPDKRISKLEFRPTEQHGLALSDKISNFDAVCTSESGEMFIVEMQGLPQDSYADRMLCYASFPIRMQLAEKLNAVRSGEIKPMDYGLLPIYVVSFVNFKIEHEYEDKLLTDGLISEFSVCSPKTGELMTDSLHFYYLELGRLTVPFGSPEKCKSIVEQLAYSLKYMKKLRERPEAFSDKLFKMLFDASEFAAMGIDKQLKVTAIMRTELDRIAENNYARKEGHKQGFAEGMEKAKEAIALLRSGHSVQDVCQATGLSEADVQAFQA